MPSVINNFYQFGEFRMDPQTRLLRRRQDVVPLTPKAFEILLLLVQNDGQLITKDQLMRTVWPDSFVEESNLTQTVFMLRKALRETPDERYILTIQGRGYRFAAPVKEIPRDDHLKPDGFGNLETVEADAVSPGSELVPIRPIAPAPPEIPQARRAPRWLWFAAASLTILIAGVVAYFHWSSSPIQRHQTTERMMLAVLPFENLTGDDSQEYFSDGLTEEMILRLGNLDPQHLGIIARTSVMHYKNSHTALEQIGRELGVQYVLEGSVRRDSDQVRVTTQLVQVKDQTHLWSRQFDRDLNHLLTLQGEIAQEIADEIQLTLAGNRRLPEARPQPLSPQAYETYDLYLRGRYFWNKRTRDGFRQGIEYFQKAIDQDPLYARAYAGLADGYAMMSIYGLAPPRELMPKARAAAVRALQLDESLAEAHTSLAVIAENYDYDWSTAEKEYRRAIQLNPNYATAHHWYAEYLAFVGRFDEAFVEIDRALRLDPLSLIIASDRGAIFYFSRQYDRAIEQFQAVQEMEPNFPRSRMVIFAYVEKGRFADALAEIAQWRRHDPTPWTWGLEAYVRGRADQQDKARRALEKLKEVNRQSRLDQASMLPMAYIAIKDDAKALASLETGYLERSNTLTLLKVDPVYDPLRSDPSFQDLMRRVGLSP